MIEFIEKLRAKPGHVRERIAWGAATGATLVVALSWLAVVTASGGFMSGGDTQYAAVGAAKVDEAITNTKNNLSNLLGAAEASQSQAAHPGIVVETTASTSSSAPSPTVIPF